MKQKKYILILIFLIVIIVILIIAKNNDKKMVLKCTSDELMDGGTYSRELLIYRKKGHRFYDEIDVIKSNQEHDQNYSKTAEIIKEQIKEYNNVKGLKYIIDNGDNYIKIHIILNLDTFLKKIMILY